MRAKSTKAETPKAAHGLKSLFVRQRPEMTVADLIAAAEAEGLPLTKGHVYNIRSADKQKGIPSNVQPRGAAAKAGRATPQPGPSISTRSPDVTALEAHLRTLVIRIGLDRAEEIFTQVKSTLSIVEAFDRKPAASAPRRMAPRGRRAGSVKLSRKAPALALSQGASEQAAN